MYRKAKSVGRWGRVGMLLHVLLLILTTPGHTTIFDLALLFDPIFLILNRLFVCLFIPSFFWLFFFKRVAIQI